MGKSISPTQAETKRPSITIPVFLNDELEALVGIYAPSLSEVVVFVVQSWLHDNEEKVERRVAKYQAFKLKQKRQG